MGPGHERLGRLQDELNELQRLRDSWSPNNEFASANTDALDQRIESLRKEISEIPQDPELGSQQPPADAAKPMDIDSMKNFETFPEWKEPAPDEPEADEPEPPGRADGGDVQRTDSVLPDLGWKAPKGPLSDEAEGQIDGENDRLPPLVGEVPPMGGPTFDELIPPPDTGGPMGIDRVKNFETFPPVPDEPPPAEPEYEGEIVARPGGGMPRMLVGASLAAVLVVGALIAFMRMNTPQVAATATDSVPPAATAASTTAAPQPSGPPAQAAAALGYQCVGNQKPLIDNSNGFGVSNGAAGGPKVSTNGKTYCLVSMRTYHWNEGKGAAPGRIGLVGGAGDVGPFQAQGTSGQGGAQNVNWIYVPDPPAKQLLNGDYTCYDSDRATWSQNDASGHLGFCAVFVQDAVKQ